jgi:hypothetical protein
MSNEDTDLINEDALEVKEEEEEEKKKEDQNPLRDIHKLFPALMKRGGHHVLEHGGQRLLSTWVGSHKNVVCKQCGNAFKGGSFANHIKQKRCLQGPPRMGKLVDEVESPKKTPKKKKAGEAKAKVSAKPKKKTANSITFPAIFLRDHAPKVKRWTDPKAIFVLQRGRNVFTASTPRSRSTLSGFASRWDATAPCRCRGGRSISLGTTTTPSTASLNWRRTGQDRRSRQPRQEDHCGSGQEGRQGERRGGRGGRGDQRKGRPEAGRS